MKLRIKGNSLRFRLGHSEVDEFAASGVIGDKVRFGGPSGNDLYYVLKTTDGNEFSGTFADGKITVTVPGSVVDAWAAGLEVSIEGVHQPDADTELAFLIEKDFVCLNAHNDDDQSDRYPHPKGPEAC
ncbi:hypothetical protein BH10ACI3_BH10ACI3_03320 [soil metagenome]